MRLTVGLVLFAAVLTALPSGASYLSWQTACRQTDYSASVCRAKAAVAPQPAEKPPAGSGNGKETYASLAPQMVDIEDPEVGFRRVFCLEISNYADALAANGIAYLMNATSISDVWHGRVSAAAIPEPAGAWLVIVGVAMLALRRQREVWS